MQYEYAEQTEELALDGAQFAGLALPADLRARLREAAHIQNVTEVKNYLGQLRVLGEREALLADYLSEQVRRYDLDAVLEIVEQTSDG